MTAETLQAIENLEHSKSDIVFVALDNTQKTVPPRVAWVMIKRGTAKVHRVRKGRIVRIREHREPAPVITDSGFNLSRYPLPNQSVYEPLHPVFARAGAGLS